jgi:hypothetical protein
VLGPDGLPLKPSLVLGENGVAFATDGTSTGDITNGEGPKIVSFSLSSGSVNWDYQVTTQSTLSIIAVASSAGGIVINDSQAGVVQLDPNGISSQESGTLGGVPEYSWAGNWYNQSSQGVSQVEIPVEPDQATFWATPAGSPSNDAAADALCECMVQTPGSGQADSIANVGALGGGSANGMGSETVFQPAAVANCPICTLPAGSQLPSCLTIPASGPTYLLLVGDPGTTHNVGFNFAIAAQTEANELQTQGNNVVACRVSSVENVASAMTANGFIGGGVIYFGHSGPYNAFDENNNVLGRITLLAPGQAIGGDSNITFQNVTQLSAVQTGYNGSNIIGTSASILINGCRAGVVVRDYYANYPTSIAQLISNQTQRGVYAYTVGMYFSLNSAQTATSRNYLGEPDPLPASFPLYLIPVGPPGNKPLTQPFVSQ